MDQQGLAAELRSEGLTLLHAMLVHHLEQRVAYVYPLTETLSPRGLTFEQEVEARLDDLNSRRNHLTLQAEGVKRKIVETSAQIRDYEHALRLYREFQSQILEDKMPKDTRPDVVHADAEGANMKVHKAAYADMCTVCGPRMAAGKRRAAHIPAFLDSLTQFGYTGLTREIVAKAYDKAMSGPITDADIIAMFIRRELEENELVSRD